MIHAFFEYIISSGYHSHWRLKMVTCSQQDTRTIGVGGTLEVKAEEKKKDHADD
jgi:hypothetical protein